MKKNQLILFLLAILLALPSVSHAIPAFARKYNISCSTCHSMVPKLKPYGEDFAGNAFRLPDAPEPPRTYVEAGDDMMLLHRFFPIAVRFDGFLQYAKRDAGEFDFQAPYGVKLMSGGPVTEDIGYYMYFYMNERGEVAGLEDAYVHFNDLFGSDLDVMLGQFQVSDPLFKRELRLSLEDYEVYRMRPVHSHANLTYDRGVMLTYGFAFGLDLVAEALNGNGIGEAENRIFDIDNGKAFAFRASQSIGPVRVGGFVYRGEEMFHNVAFSYAGGALQVSDVKNVVTYFGPDLTIGNDYVELNAQYLHRIDSDIPFASTEGTALRENTMDGIMAELVWLPGGPESTWGFVGLYNMAEDKDSGWKYHTATLSASRLLARNLRLIGEVTYDLEEETPRVSVGFVSGF
ncbi:MAG: hypothetical protein RBU27_08995 [Bacteroidota bacterium]|jgi:hypothetical protein|nr:hypothetical protein [Bacteroidota bacterium]